MRGRGIAVAVLVLLLIVLAGILTYRAAVRDGNVGGAKPSAANGHAAKAVPPGGAVSPSYKEEPKPAEKTIPASDTRSGELFDDLATALSGADSKEEKDRALGKARQPESVRALAHVALDPATDIEVRIRAAEIIGECGAADQVAVSCLVSLLENEYARLRQPGLKGLSALAGDNFGFDAAKEPKDQKEAVEKWKAWARARAAAKP